MIGRHFLVYSEQAPRIKRQYTICSSMNADITSALLSLAAKVCDNTEAQFDEKLFMGQDQSSIDLTLKTYDKPKGLATRIHNTKVAEKNSAVVPAELPTVGESYYIKGPMGRGLQLQPSGDHVAFCAGTGVLVFLDLVAQLLMVNAFQAEGKALPEEMQYFQPGFKLHLYVAFQSRQQSIGLDLIEALVRVNEKLGLDNFKLTLRLSESEGKKLPRWTEEWIKTEMEPLAGKIQKIWVCGPPVMNELFDKTLEKITKQLQIERH